MLGRLSSTLARSTSVARTGFVAGRLSMSLSTSSVSVSRSVALRRRLAPGALALRRHGDFRSRVIGGSGTRAFSNPSAAEGGEEGKEGAASADAAGAEAGVAGEGEQTAGEAEGAAEVEGEQPAAEAEGEGGEAAEAAEGDSIEAIKEEAAEWKNKYITSLAEIENVRGRAARDVETARTYAIQKFAKSLLEVADNLARATEAVDEASIEKATQLAAELEDGDDNDEKKVAADLKVLFEGVALTEAGLLKTLGAQGIERFGEAGEVFDPHRHDAMFEYDDPSLPEERKGTVGQVLKTGYTFHERVLRPCQVGVIKK